VRNESLFITGGSRLSGPVSIEGAKNAALPECVAALLTDAPVVLHRIPELRDVSTILFTLSDLGKRVVRRGTSVVLASDRPLSSEANAYSVRQMRASFLVLGPIVARLGRATVPLPGGCAIGERSVDLHLSGLRSLGARISERGSAVYVEADRLQGTRIELAFPSVGTTEQLLMAAALARGETEIRGASIEPEVIDLIALLRRMGSEIAIEDRTLRIAGREELGGAEHSVVSDRMEAGTYLIAGAITGGEVRVEGADAEALDPLLRTLDEMGVQTRVEEGAVSVVGGGRPRATRVETAPHPGFPTDLHPPVAALLALAEGTSRITETVFERRHTYVEGLRAMGAQIALDGPNVAISGVPVLRGRRMTAPDIRAGAALVLAGLAASGESEIDGLDKIDRGYAAMERKLCELGATIERRSAS